MIQTYRIAVVALLILFPCAVAEYNFGSCQPLSDPVGNHPINAQTVNAGYLSIQINENEITATTVCNENEGWIVTNRKQVAVRCRRNTGNGYWQWDHNTFNHRTIPAPRCSYVSPKMIYQRYNLPDFNGCLLDDDNTAFTEIVALKVSEEVPCIKRGECKVHSVKCEHIKDYGAKLLVKIKSVALVHVEKQKILLSEASDVLKHINGFDLKKGDHRIAKRNFFDEDPDDSGGDSNCNAGQVESNSVCETCTAGTYADTASTPQSCATCDYDKYSGSGAATCTDCESGKGTINQCSTRISECIVVCTVPTIAVTKSMSPAGGGRAAVDGDVTVECSTNYQYGSGTVATIQCSTANFPSSCRKIDVTTATESVQGGVTATLTCTNEAHTAPATISWYFGTSGTAIAPNDSN